MTGSPVRGPGVVGVAVLVAGLASIATADPPSGFTRGVPRPSGPRGDVGVLGLPPALAQFVQPRRPVYRFPTDATIPDFVDVLHLADARPVRTRLTITVDGRPFLDAWKRLLRDLFTTFDRDGDGELNPYEAERIFPIQGLRTQLAGHYSYRDGDIPAFELLDQDADGRVSFDEMTAYYWDAAAGLLGTVVVAGSDVADRKLTRELFARLDTDRDGRLTRAELRAAERLVLALDTDEDEVLTAAEITGGESPGTMPSDNDPDPAKDLLVSVGGHSPDALEAALKKYVGRWPDLDRWRTGPPDLLATVNVSSTIGERTVQLRPGPGTSTGLELRTVHAARAVVKIGQQLCDIGHVPTVPAPSSSRVAEQVASLFPDNDKKAYREADLMGPNQQFLRIVFDDADANCDGQLTRAEFRKFLDVQQKVIDSVIVVGYGVRTPSLFQLIDDNGDDCLGVRELRTAYDRLMPLQPSGDAVTREALVPSAAVRIGARSTVRTDGTLISTVGLPAKQADARPAWFVKMDRNGDGDLSRTEFLGPKDRFDGMDADGDGLVSVAEAVAYVERQPGAVKKK